MLFISPFETESNKTFSQTSIHSFKYLETQTALGADLGMTGG
jgi:hypothetical protein